MDQQKKELNSEFWLLRYGHFSFEKLTVLDRPTERWAITVKEREAASATP